MKFTARESYCFTVIVFVLTRQETIKNNNTEQYLLFSNSGRFSWHEQNQDLSRRLTKFLVDHSLPHLLATFFVNCSFLCGTKRKFCRYTCWTSDMGCRGDDCACDVLEANLYGSPNVRWSWFRNLKKNLLVESGVQLKESGIPRTIGMLESKFHWQGMWIQLPGNLDPQRGRIPDCLCFPYIPLRARSLPASKKESKGDFCSFPRVLLYI